MATRAFPPPVFLTSTNRTSNFVCQVGHPRRVHGCGCTLHSSEGEPGSWKGETGKPTLPANAVGPPGASRLYSRFYVRGPLTLPPKDAFFLSVTFLVTELGLVPVSPRVTRTGWSAPHDACYLYLVRCTSDSWCPKFTHGESQMRRVAKKLLLFFSHLEIFWRAFFLSLFSSLPLTNRKKPSIYETRVAKKFFEQHDDPSTTSEISDYVRQVCGRRERPPPSSTRSPSTESA